MDKDPGTVNQTGLLGTPDTVTTTFPVVAPDGTGTAMLEELQLVGLAVAPPNVTVLLPCVDPKNAPEIVILAPTGAEFADKLEILGGLGLAGPVL